MDIGSGFDGDNRQRYLRIALIIGVAFVVLLLILIVVAIVRSRGGSGDATATPQRTPSRSASPIVASAAPSSRPPTVAVSVPPSAGPSAAASAPASASAQPAASASAKAYVVANTDGEGVRMRSEPSTSASEIVILPDGTRLVEISPGRNAEGRDWLHVKVQGGDNDGKEGWVAAEFTSSAP